MAADAFLIGRVGGGTSPQTTPTGYTTTTGSALFLFVTRQSSATIASVTDSESNTYSQIGTTLGAVDQCTDVYACYNATGGADHTLTVTWSASPAGASIFFVEVTGVTATPLDVNVNGVDALSPFTATSGTLAQADEVLLSFCASDSTNNPTTYASSNFTILASETNGSSNWTAAIGKLVVSATTSITPSWTSSGAATANVHVLSFKALAATLEQEGFRGYNDDAAESSMTAIAAQDTAFNVPLSTNFILRQLINTIGDAPSQQYRLDYKKSTDSTYVPVLTAAPSAPTYQALGSVASGTGNVTVNWPTHQAGDIGILFVESCGGQVASLGTANGFAAISGSPSATGATTSGTQLTAYWCRATSAAMASPVITDPGDHAVGYIITFRGCIAEGSPFDGSAVAAQKATASTSASAPGITTTIDNALVVAAISRDNDSASAAFSSWTNASLASITERGDTGSTQGNGGGIGVATGVKTSAGSVSTTTATVTSSINASLTFALIPQSTPIIMAASSNITAGGANTTARLTAPSGKTTSDFTAGRIQDDENPCDAINIAADQYTEIAWCLKFQSPAVDDDAYDFRVTVGGVALDTYTVTPRVTVGSGGINARLVGSHGTADDTPVSSTAGTSNATGSTFVALLSYGSNQSVTGVTDSKGNGAYTLVDSQTNNGVTVDVWVLENGAGGSGHYATATLSGSGAYPTIYLVEIVGGSATPVDVHAKAADSTTPYTVTTPTLSQADELILTIAGYSGFGGAAHTSSNTTTVDVENNTYYYTSIVTKKVVSATTAFTPSFTNGLTTPDGALIAVTFKQFGGTSDTPLSVTAGALTLTGAEIYGEVAVEAAEATLTLTGQVITLTATANVTLAVDAAALTLAGQSITLTPTANVTLAVDVVALTLAWVDVTLAATANEALAVDAASLTLAGEDVTLDATFGVTMSVTAAALTLAGADVTLSFTDSRTLAVDAASLNLAGVSITLTATDNKSVSVTEGSLTLAGATITLAATANAFLSVDAASLTLAGQSVTLAKTDHVWMSVTAGALTLAGAEVGFAYTDSRTLAVDAGDLTLSGVNIALQAGNSAVVAVEPVELTLGGAAVTLTHVDNVSLALLPAGMTLTGQTVGLTLTIALSASSLSVAGQGQTFALTLTVEPADLLLSEGDIGLAATANAWIDVEPAVLLLAGAPITLKLRGGADFHCVTLTAKVRSADIGTSIRSAGIDVSIRTANITIVECEHD